MIFLCCFITILITLRWHSGWNMTLGCMYLMVGVSSYIYCRCHQINQGDRGWWKVLGLFTVCWPDLLSVIYFVEHQRHLWVGFSTMLRTRSHKSIRASCLYLFLSLFPLSLLSLAHFSTARVPECKGVAINSNKITKKPPPHQPIFVLPAAFWLAVVCPTWSRFSRWCR